MYYRKKQVDGLNPTLKVFNGCAPVIIISFLTTLRDKFDTIGVYEAAAVRMMAYVLGGDAKEVLSE